MEPETKGYFLIGLGIILVLIALLVFSATKTSPPSTEQETLEECKTLSYNGLGKINMLFFAKDKNQVEKYTNFFLDAKPFKENQEAFNFFYIEKRDYDAESRCGLYKEIAILCDDKDIRKKAASCPNDFVVVLAEEDSKIRSSSYLNILSLNSKHLLTVFLHEFAHGFGNLAEEYINNQRPPRNSPNCVSECSDFEGETDGCFEGCSLTTLQRSVDEGVMRTLSPEDPENPYGTFNSNLIQELILEREKAIIDNPTTGQATHNFEDQCANQEYILVEIKQSETIKTVHQGCPGTNGQGPNKYTVTEDSKTVSEGSYNPQIFTDKPNKNNDLSGETYEDPTQSLLLTLPVQGDELNIFDSDENKIQTIPLNDAGATPCPA
jgi:hypothetical protein